MKSNLNKFIVPVLVLSGLFVFLLLTNPRNLPLPALLVPFLAIGLFTYLVSGLIFGKILNKGAVKARIWSLLMAFEISLLMLLSSLRQISWKDIVLAVVFGVIFLWYFGRMTSR